VWARASRGCPITLPAGFPGCRPNAANIQREPTRTCSARKREHHHDLWLRPSDRHAGTEVYPLSDQSGLRKKLLWARMKFSLRRRPLHRLQRVRHRVQERERGGLGQLTAGGSSTINDGKARRAVSLHGPACTAPTRPCAAVCPVSCIFPTEEGVWCCNSKDLCIGCGYCFLRVPVRRAAIPARRVISDPVARWTNVLSCAGGRRSGKRPAVSKNLKNTGPTVSRKESFRSVPRCARPSHCWAGRRRDPCPDLQKSGY